MPFRFGIQLGLFSSPLFLLSWPSLAITPHPLTPHILPSSHCPGCRCLCPPGTMLTIKLNLFSYFVSLRFVSPIPLTRPPKVKVLSSAADVADNYVPPARTKGAKDSGQRTTDNGQSLGFIFADTRCQKVLRSIPNSSIFHGTSF